MHPAWHGEWCWQKVMPLLEAKGHKVVVFDLPGHGQDPRRPEQVSFQDYVQKVVQMVDAQSKPAVLLGHSRGGVVISQAAEQLCPQKVAKLVYPDAFLPQDGEPLLDVAKKSFVVPPAGVKPAPSLAFNVPPDGKTCSLPPDMVQNLLYSDCSKVDMAAAQALLCPEPMTTFVTPVRLTSARFGAIPKDYILCTQAKDFDKWKVPANRPCQKVYTLPSGHMPFYSMPKRLVAILHEL
ncbi:MAG TPA: alpha/beta fold hydrolase [Hymenobacter sp.]|uniref:alpha/beta fold hydrolase n=1 Tax=Hymenobacter sp. TaxID=1898978 RepID=UPI002EDAA792